MDKPWPKDWQEDWNDPKSWEQWRKGGPLWPGEGAEPTEKNVKEVSDD